MIELSTEVKPRWPLRLPRRGGPDGVLRLRDGVLWRLMHHEGEPVVAWARPASGGRVALGARSSAGSAAAEWGMKRLGFALGVDDDLRPFHERFRWDPLLGPLLRRDPGLRVLRRPEPFEALAWAVCEQLIDFGRASAIQRRIVRRLGARCEETGLRDVPSAARIAGVAPAQLEAFDLSGSRARALVRAAREVAAGRVDLAEGDPEAGWRRLEQIPGLGRWTIEMLALHGQGRLDQVPAADLNFLKLVGRLRTGDPRSRATEEEVREVLAPYHPWCGLAGAYLMRLPPEASTPLRARDPRPAGTRWSARAARPAAA